MSHLLLVALLSLGADVSAAPVQLAQATVLAPAVLAQAKTNPAAGDPAKGGQPPVDEKAAAAAKQAVDAGNLSGKAAAGVGKDAEAKGADGKAAEEAPAAEESAEEEADAAAAKGFLEKLLGAGAIGYMIGGGIFMWPILILGVIAGGVLIERYRTLKMLRTDTTALRSQVQELLQEDRVEDAYRLCEEQQGPVAAILSTGLRQYMVLRRLGYDSGRIEDAVVKAMDDYSVHIVAALERHLPILATVSSVAPMLGFLGTVQGMIVSFDEIVATMGEKNIVEAAAGGISIALLTTCFGLIVGIPAFMAFNYFTSVINQFVLEVEESASELIEVVTLQLTMQKAAAGQVQSARSDDDELERVSVAYNE